MNRMTSDGRAVKAKRSKPTRGCRYYPTPGGAGNLAIRVGDVTEWYRVVEIGSDFGRSFRVTKASGVREGAEYDVCLAGNGQQHCCCMSACKRQTCRHTEALRACIDRGALEGGYPAAGGAPECGDDQEGA